MSNYSLDKYDFKKYLLDLDNSARVEELIFWKKSIPLPLDLIYRIFDERGELIQLYLTHICTALLYNAVVKEKFDDYLLFENTVDSLPGLSQDTQLDRIINTIKRYYTSKLDTVQELVDNMASLLLIENFVLDFSEVKKCLEHNGRKYKRIYIPSDIKDLIGDWDTTNILKKIGISNRDMFGNVVADHFNIYRSGFSDAFAGIFNRLLDFIMIFSKSIHADKLKITGRNNFRIFSEAKKSKSKNDDVIEYGEIMDGSFWEPKYIDNDVSFCINSKHPYYDFLKDIESNKSLFDLLKVMSRMEMNTFSDSEQKKLEIFRHNISRELRLLNE